MLIVADENIPLLESFFEDIGEIRRVSGRHLSAGDVRDADVLLVRSVTRVGADLLAGSRVKFVGTATIGTDHVDKQWLRDNGIGFSAAPGCNANSVVEYVLAVLSLHAERCGFANGNELSIGIVGAGNVGDRLAGKLQRLGFNVLLCDPPRAQAEGDQGPDFVSLERALECDVVTLHTPLTQESEHPTHNMIGEEQLAQLNAGQLLINSGRGEVINTGALKTRLQEADAPLVALDVWENEPAIDPELVELVWLATPHIAGYSLEGKVRGTEMIYQALSKHLGLPVRKKAGQFLPEPPLSKLTFTSTADEQKALRTALRVCYDPRTDDVQLRLAMIGEDGQRAEAFDALRKNYPVRRECSSLKVQLKGAGRSMQESFKAVGFKLKL